MEEQNVAIVTKVCKVCGQEKDITEFHKSAWGVTGVCKECVRSKKQASKNDKSNLANAVQLINEAKTQRLEIFTDDELLAEIHRRGYDGVISKTEVITKDLSKL